jgi:hypothetical protein
MENYHRKEEQRKRMFERPKNCCTFLNIMVVRKTSFSAHRRVFHKVSFLQTLEDMLQNGHKN